jgi:glutamine---fructose-6-phosphate transaminase (isomerizing)
LEQPESIARAMSYGARMDGKQVPPLFASLELIPSSAAAQVILGGLDTHKRDLVLIRNMLLTGCGTSKYASEYGAKLMRDMDCFETVSVLDSAEVPPLPPPSCELINR